jgi:hypothetical protein
VVEQKKSVENGKYNVWVMNCAINGVIPSLYVLKMISWDVRWEIVVKDW